MWHENSNQYVHGIYVGPAWNGIMSEPTPGAIRVMYKAGTGVQIVVTQQYKCVTNGFHIDIERAAQQSLQHMLVGPGDNTAASLPDPSASISTTAPLGDLTVTVGGGVRQSMVPQQLD